MRWFGVMGIRSTASTGLLFALALAVLLASDVRVAACVYFRPGVTSTWDYTSANWLRGDALQTWGDGSDAGFDEASVGTTGTRLVTVTDTIASVNSITFSANGCTLDGGTLTLTGTTASGGYISVADGCTGVINSTLAGSGGLQKVDYGTLTLGGANTFTGDTYVYTGMLRLAHSHALQNSTYQGGDGGILRFGELRAATLGGLNGYGTLTLANENSESVALSVGNNNASTTFRGELIGAADSSLVKIGSGTLTLRNSGGSFYGDTVLRSGTLEVGTSNLYQSTLDAQGGTLRCMSDLPIVGLGGLKGSGDLALDDVTLCVGSNDQSTTYSGVLSGSVALEKMGSGALTLAGANTFTGDIVVDSGVLAIASTGSLLLDINTQDASSAITGYGAIAFDGSLLFDLTDLSASDSWNVLAVETLTESFGSNFGAMFLVGGNSYAAMEYEPGVWMREIDAFGTAAFSEATGILTVTMVPEPGVLTLLLTGLVGLAVYGLRKRA